MKFDLAVENGCTDHLLRSQGGSSEQAVTPRQPSFVHSAPFDRAM